MQAQLLHAAELVGAGELHMYHAAADVGVWVQRCGVLVCIQHPVQDAVADGVDGGGHIAAAGQSDHLVELLLGEDGNALFLRRIGVRLGHVGRPCSQGAVAQHLQRADPEHVATHAGGVAHVQEGLQTVGVGELALLIHPDGEAALCLHLPEGREHILPIHVFEATEVIGLTGGHAHAVQGPAGGADHALQVGPGGLGQTGLHQHHGCVPEHAGGIPPGIQIDRATLGDRGIGVDPQNFQGTGVDRQAVAAAAGDADGAFGVHRIQIMPGGDISGWGEVILIPAPAQKPALGVFCSKMAQGVLQGFQRGGGGAGEAAHFHGVAVIEQVHVAVVEAGTDKAALQRDADIFRLAQRKHLVIRTHGSEAAILHDEGFGDGQRTGENPAASIDCSHDFSPFKEALILLYQPWRNGQGLMFAEVKIVLSWVNK